MIGEEKERKQRQGKLADLFFEMGMDLDLIEKVSGMDKKEFLNKRIKKNKSENVPLTINSYDSSMYIENRNSY